MCMTCGVSQELRCYVAVHLTLSSGEFTSTSSHMCDTWHLPVILFREGSMTQMRMASLIDLEMFCSFLSIY